MYEKTEPVPIVDLRKVYLEEVLRRWEELDQRWKEMNALLGHLKALSKKEKER